MTVRSMKRRVALLIDAIEDDYQAGIVRGADRASAHANIQLVCIAGGVLSDVGGDPRCSRNFLFDLLPPGAFDGMLALSGALGNQIGVAQFARWMDRFRSTPQVNLGVEVPERHSIAVDGASGMRAVISHLTRTHGHRRIAFIRGPHTSEEAEERYTAYRDALQEDGIPFDQGLVLDGTWLRESGAEATRELFQRRGVGVDTIGAIACANDYMAFGAMDELRKRGIDVPGTMALTGFDDLETSRNFVPPLSTARQPLEALGREGLRRLVALMNGGEVPLSLRLVADMVARRSCGCANIDTIGGQRPVAPQTKSFEVAFMERRALLSAELVRSAQGALFAAGSGWEERLITALLIDFSGAGSSAFVTAIDQIMVKLQYAGGDLRACQSVLTAMRRGVHEYAAADNAASIRADEILDDARALVSEWMVRTEILRRIENLRQLRELSGLSSFLMGGPTRKELQTTLERRLRELGISAMSVGLFTEPGRVTEHCLSLVAYGATKHARDLDTFRSNDLAPPEVLASENGTLLVQPLVFGSQPMGIVTCAFGALDTVIYEQMREILGTALQGFRLATELRVKG